MRKSTLAKICSHLIDKGIMSFTKQTGANDHYYFDVEVKIKGNTYAIASVEPQYWQRELLATEENVTTYAKNGNLVYMHTSTDPNIIDMFVSMYDLSNTTGWSQFDKLSPVLEFLWYENVKLSWLFKNGKVRKAKIKSFVTKVNNTSVKRSYVLQSMYKDIEALWSKFDSDTLNLLSNYCGYDEDGEFLAYSTVSSAYVLTETGGTEVKQIYLSKYRRAFDGLVDGISSYVRTTEPRTETITILNGNSLNVTQREALCFNKMFVRCSSCGSLELRSNTVFGLCQTCSDVDFNRPVLLAYNERATSHFDCSISPKGNPRLLGFELEYEVKNTSNIYEAGYLLKKTIGDHAILKRDGSLRNGVEICTRPASIDVHQDSFTRMFSDDKLFDVIESKDTCGMHVHVDKRKMTWLTIGKLLQFMTATHNRDFIKLIAGRESQGYARIGQDYKATAVVRGATLGRYNGLNLLPTNTIEFRVFASPKTYEECIRNAQFCNALVDYMQPGNVSVKDKKWEGFVQYLHKFGREYRELNSFVKASC